MNTTYVATAGLEAAPLQDGAVLYNLKTSKFIMLNRPASILWTELSKPRSENDLVTRMSATYPDIPDSVARQGVSQVLKNLAELELVGTRPGADGEDASTSAPQSVGNQAEDRKDKLMAYESPSVKVLNEEELLNLFQMTAAEISVAACWWGACPTGCAL
jgi:hypothetical protein